MYPAWQAAVVTCDSGFGEKYKEQDFGHNPCGLRIHLHLSPMCQITDAVYPPTAGVAMAAADIRLHVLATIFLCSIKYCVNPVTERPDYGNSG